MKLAITAAMLLLTTPTLCWAPSASAITGDEMCKAMHWPMPLPPTVGWSLEHTGYDTVFQCHDAMNDSVRDASSWKVTSMTPPAGTMVPMNQKIQLTVVRDYNAPS
jgi:hypothetical protein